MFQSTVLVSTSKQTNCSKSRQTTCSKLPDVRLVWNFHVFFLSFPSCNTGQKSNSSLFQTSKGEEDIQPNIRNTGSKRYMDLQHTQLFNTVDVRNKKNIRIGQDIWHWDIIRRLTFARYAVFGLLNTRYLVSRTCAGYPISGHSVGLFSEYLIICPLIFT